VSGDGDVIFIEKEIFVVTLPTSAAWDFYIDPQGLVGAFREDKLNDPLAIAAAAGMVLPMEYTPVAVNKSSVDVTVSAEIKVTGDAVVLTTGQTAVNTGTANNIQLNVIASTAMVNDVSKDQTDFVGTVETPITAAGTTLKFVLQPADYEVGGDPTDGFTYTIKDDDDGHGTQLSIGGFVNKNADWSDFTAATTPKVVGLSAVFDFAKATPAEIAQMPNATAYGMLSGTIGFTSPATGGNNIDGGTFAAVVNVPFTTGFNFGGHTPTAFTANGGPFTPTGTMFDTATNTINLSFGTAGSRAYTFSVDGVTYSFTVNVTAS
jgi:hypothetical protein